MRIRTETSTVLCVYFPRRFIGDFFALAFLAFGILALIAAVLSEPGFGRIILFAFGLAFAGIGIVIALTHAATTATLDATTQTATIHWRALKRHETRIIPFAEIARITLHASDDCQTVKIVLTDKSDVVLEKGFSGNEKAAPMARHMDAWLLENKLSAT